MFSIAIKEREIKEYAKVIENLILNNISPNF
jgi:hypothetical protein